MRVNYTTEIHGKSVHYSIRLFAEAFCGFEEKRDSDVLLYSKMRRFVTCGRCRRKMQSRAGKEAIRKERARWR